MKKVSDIALLLFVLLLILFVWFCIIFLSKMIVFVLKIIAIILAAMALITLTFLGCTIAAFVLFVIYQSCAKQIKKTGVSWAKIKEVLYVPVRFVQMLARGFYVSIWWLNKNLRWVLISVVFGYIIYCQLPSTREQAASAARVDAVIEENKRKKDSANASILTISETNRVEDSTRISYAERNINLLGTNKVSSFNQETKAYHARRFAKMTKAEKAKALKELEASEKHMFEYRMESILRQSR